MKYLLGVDVGTTGTKTSVFREDGHNVSSAYRGYGMVNDCADWAEQNPEDWWNAVSVTVREATAGLTDPENIAALSLSTQGGSLVVLDAEGTALIPAVSWMDRRAGEDVLAKIRQGKETDYHYIHTGWKLTNSSSPNCLAAQSSIRCVSQGCKVSVNVGLFEFSAYRSICYGLDQRRHHEH